MAPNPWKDRISIQVKRGCKTPLRLTLLVGFVVQQTERNDALDCEVFFIVETSSSFVFQDVVLTIHYTASVCVYILSAHLGSTFGMHTHSLKAPLFDDV